MRRPLGDIARRLWWARAGKYPGGHSKALGFGVDAIEIDAQASADGVPVLMHDLTVDRTTNGTGDVASLSFDELRALDAGGEPVPALADVLDLTIGTAALVIEIKQPGIEQSIAEVVREREGVNGYDGLVLLP